ncbi:MAG: hypothetical protein ABIK93_09020, partial [candidate division WOR-3 bacterium]
MLRNNNKKVAQIWLIVLFAISMVMAGGRKPKFDQVSSTMRPLAGSEVKELVERIPAILTEALGPDTADFEEARKKG